MEEKKIKNFHKSSSFTNYLLVAFSISITVSFFVSSYSTVRIANTLSYHTNDGWCDPTTEGFGEHCFGDFYAPLQFANTENPWNGPISNYPPAAYILMKPFSTIHGIWPGRIALIAFLSLAFACLIFPILHMYWRKLAPTSILGVALLVTLTSGPSVTLIDRGNVLIFALPAIYMYLYKIKKQDFKSAVLYGVFFTVIKPQLILLAFLLLAMKKYKLVAKWILLSTIVTFASFLFYPSNILHNISKWVISTVKYQSYSAVGVLEPVNVSLKSSIDVIANIFGQTINSTITQLIIYTLFGLSVYNFLKKFKQQSTEMNFLAVSLFPILFVGTTFHYYLVILLPPLYMILINKSETNEFSVFRTSNRKINLEKMVIWLYVIILIPITIPWSSTGHFQGRGWENISMHWLLAQITLSVCGLYLLLERIKIRK
jgi:hypothetical protein